MGELACAQNAYTAPASSFVEIATQTNGCQLTASVNSPDGAYGFTGCPNQYVMNIVHIYAMHENIVSARPVTAITDPTTCAATEVDLSVWARDDHQNNPWTQIGTHATAKGVWGPTPLNVNPSCTFAVGVQLPDNTTYTSLMAAASAQTDTVNSKGMSSQSFLPVNISVSNGMGTYCIK
jgi:hypothetical protein